MKELLEGRSESAATLNKMPYKDDKTQRTPYSVGNALILSAPPTSQAEKHFHFLNLLGAALLFPWGREFAQPFFRQELTALAYLMSSLPSFLFLILRYSMKTGRQRKRLGWWLRLGMAFVVTPFLANLFIFPFIG